jgi:hypothetical protein
MLNRLFQDAIPRSPPTHRSSDEITAAWPYSIARFGRYLVQPKGSREGEMFFSLYDNFADHLGAIPTPMQVIVG